MRRDREHNKYGWMGDDKSRYIKMAAIPAAILIVAGAAFIMLNRPSSKPSGIEETGSAAVTDSGIEVEIQGDSSEADEGVSPDNDQYVTDFSQYELQKDEIPQVNQLISEYFQAKVDQDAAALYKLFGKEGEERLEERQEELEAEAVYIEDYQNITCYTRPGLTENSYVVYVTYEVKFRRVDTLAPGLMWCYVVQEGDRSVIRENVVGEEADYVAKQNQTEDVRLLSAQVNERLRQAIESDTLLAGIYKNLRNGAVVSEAGEEGEDSAVELIDGAAVPD